MTAPAPFSPRCIWHFLQRLHERYGIVLAPGEYDEMRADITEGRAERIACDHWRRSSVYRLRHRATHTEIQAIVDHETGLLITALKPNSYNRIGQRWTKTKHTRGAA